MYNKFQLDFSRIEGDNILRRDSNTNIGPNFYNSYGLMDNLIINSNLENKYIIK